MKALGLIAVLTLSGCAMTPAERSWQILHGLDVAYTVNGPASDPCYKEIAWDTRAMIGEHPSTGSVIGWGIAMSVAHYYAGRWLDNRDWPDAVKTTLRSIDLGYKGLVIAQSHSAGIRPFGDNVSCAPTPAYRPDAQPLR